jgi:hypothetical protein
MIIIKHSKFTDNQLALSGSLKCFPEYYVCWFVEPSGVDSVELRD